MTAPDARHRAPPPRRPEVRPWVWLTLAALIVVPTVALAAWLAPDPAPPRAEPAPVTRSLWVPPTQPVLPPLDIAPLDIAPLAAEAPEIATSAPLPRSEPRRVTATPSRTITAPAATEPVAPAPLPPEPIAPEPPPVEQSAEPAPEPEAPPVIEEPEPEVPVEPVPPVVEDVVEPEEAP